MQFGKTTLSGTGLHDRGWMLLPNAVPMDKVEWMRSDLNVARVLCREAQESAGIPNVLGTVHHLPALKHWATSYWWFLESNPAANVISEYFAGKPYILNSMGGNFNEGHNYANAIHRDIRSFQDPCPMLNTLVMLDDFTADNGATWLMDHGHMRPFQPHEQDFKLHATQVIAPAGSILLWNSNLWHRAGVNKTGKPRRIVTPIYSRPWMKQGFDYPRAIGYDADLSPELRQILGYNARVPATLDEWYQPPEKRMYKGDQG